MPKSPILPIDDAICSNICYAIANTLDLNQSLDCFEIALTSDPTQSAHAAHIRDCIRMNFDPDNDLEMLFARRIARLTRKA